MERHVFHLGRGSTWGRGMSAIRRDPPLGQRLPTRAIAPLAPAQPMMRANRTSQTKRRKCQYMSAQLDAETHGDGHPPRLHDFSQGAGEGGEAAHDVQAVQSGDQVEEGIGRIAGQEIAQLSSELPPGKDLTGRTSTRTASSALEMDQEMSELGTNENNLGPSTSRRTTHTTVFARDQQTIVISGLTRERRSATPPRRSPYFGDIPLIGFFFRNTPESHREARTFILHPHPLRHRGTQPMAHRWSRASCATAASTPACTTATRNAAC